MFQGLICFLGIHWFVRGGYYPVDEITCMLFCIWHILMFCQGEWKMVAEEHNKLFLEKERDESSIKLKYQKVVEKRLELATQIY
jgi:hypothetical protein